MLRYSGGDARKLLNILELVIESDTEDPIEITDEKVVDRLQQNPLAYDKDGEMHYDIISAFIKSIRGSDPDGAIYWLARMFSDDLDKALATFVLANGAAATGEKVTIFFTFWGLNAIKRTNKPKVQKDIFGKMFSMMLPSDTMALKLSKMHMFLVLNIVKLLIN